MLNKNNRNVVVPLIHQQWKCLLSGNNAYAHYSESQQNNNSEKMNNAEHDEQNKSEKRKLNPIQTLKKYVPERVVQILKLEPGNLPETNLAFIDEQSGPEQKDVDVPMKVIVKEMPSFARRETKKLADACRDRIQFYYNNPDFHTNCSGAAHTETMIQYQFRTESDMEKWQTGCDSDNSQGFSKCNLYKSDLGTAIFEGILSKRLVKDGIAKRAGWCTMRSIDTNPFVFKKRYNWENYSHVIIKCRGDGRTYKVMLHTPEFADVTFGDSYSYPLHTHGGPYWQYEHIPFSRFFHTVYGRIMDRQYPITQTRISSFGIVLMDRIEGPFRLEIDFIGVYKDISHKEEFAYERYNIPAVTG